MRGLNGSLLGSLLVLTFAGSPAFGQSTSSGQQPTTIDRDMDLPIDAPVLQQPAKKPTPPPPPPPPPPPTTPITPPPTFYGQALTSESSTIMYVIDVSGSMMYLDGFTTRLDRAKAELNKSIAALPNNFKFNIVAFDCSVYSWQPTLVPADANDKANAESWVSGLIAEGGTATGPGVSLGLAVKDNKLVVLLTDGEPNCGAGDQVDGDPTCIAAHRAMIQSANTQRAVINVFGIAAVGEFRQFCLDIAADSGGTYTDVQ